MIYFINKETKEHRVYKSGDVVDSRTWKIVEAEDDGWIEWEGESDSSPVPCATLCRIKLSDGCELETMAPEEWSCSRGGDQHIIAYRPILEETKAPEWDGEGFPPVGIRCEAYRQGGWKEVYIVGFCEDGSCVMDTGSAFKVNYDPDKFRPIRTDAQRAQDEAVGAMADVYRKAPHFSIYENIKCVYAAIRDGEIPGVRLTGNPRR